MTSRSPKKLSGLSIKELMSQHSVTHFILPLYKTREGTIIYGYSREELGKRHDILAAEMVRRGLIHKTPLEATDVAKKD